ncbi:MAG: hypothetical protein ACR2OR_07780, partial [Hyphomicrobiales bacterium]
REEFRTPYQVEMLSVFLTRAFTVDIVEHLAKAKAPDTAVNLAPDLRRRLGVGNSTGLGMAPFLANHPVLFNNWIKARETALARVRGLPVADDDSITTFKSFLARQRIAMDGWNTADTRQQERIEILRTDLEKLETFVSDARTFSEPTPWDRIFRWGEENLSLEGQECLAGLLIEPHGDLVDNLSDELSADEQASFAIDGSMKIDVFCKIIRQTYGFALDVDFNDPRDCARFWYVSEEKLEPRLGERHEDPGAELESPLAIARDIAHCYRAASEADVMQTLVEFLLKHPEYRHVARRAQIAAREPYAEIQDNLISADVLPIDLLRCKLSFFGATRFDPRSDRWVRINMFQHAPFPDELSSVDVDTWIYPPRRPHDS